MSAAPYLLLFGWLAIVFAGIPLFGGETSVAFKRRFFRSHVGLSGCLGVVALAVVQPWSLLLAVPLMGVVMHRQVTTTRFCDTCTRMSAGRFDVCCARCGDRLPDRG